MLLALLGPTYPYRGGISHYTTLLYRHLAQRHTVTFFSFSRQYPTLLFPGKSDRDPSQAVLGAPAHYTLDSLNPITWFGTARRIAQTGASWLIIPWWVPFWAVPFFTIARTVRRAGMRVLFWCHNVAPHEAGLADRVLTRLVLSQGQVFVALSPRDETLLHQLFPQRAIYRTTLPMLNAFAAQTVGKETACHQLGLDSRKPIALFFGFVRPYKGLHYLLEALAQVRGTMDVHLLVVGEFWQDKKSYLGQIQRLRLDRAVTVVDRYVANEEVPRYFSAADVVVLPYMETSQSAVMQLAYGFGKPVITTRVAGMASAALGADERLLVPPRDSAALAETMRAFFASPSSFELSRSDASESSWAALIETLETGIQSYDQAPD
jgi:glycosyltransferase involved in cell wall biosynthesis